MENIDSEARILIIDDDAFKVDLISRLLRIGGYTAIFSETDSARATKAFGFATFDCDIVACV